MYCYKIRTVFFNNVIDGALMRAVRYSSAVSAFNEEQRLIKLMLLYNGLVFPTEIFRNPFISTFLR